LPPAGEYATGLVFLTRDEKRAARAKSVLEKYALAEGARVLGWRDVPVNPDGLGKTALDCMPRVAQLFIAADGVDGDAPAGIELERVAFCVRKQPSGRPATAARAARSSRCRRARSPTRAC
jgi:glutamate synthase (NADPH/NADH) large chain